MRDSPEYPCHSRPAEPVFCFALGWRDVRFILVNGRAPRPQAFCVKCDQPIEKRYLREIGTHLIYCDHDCYADHCQSAFQLLENRARAS